MYNHNKVQVVVVWDPNSCCIFNMSLGTIAILYLDYEPRGIALSYYELE